VPLTLRLISALKSPFFGCAAHLIAATARRQIRIGELFCKVVSHCCGLTIIQVSALTLHPFAKVSFASQALCSPYISSVFVAYELRPTYGSPHEQLRLTRLLASLKVVPRCPVPATTQKSSLPPFRG